MAAAAGGGGEPGAGGGPGLGGRPGELGGRRTDGRTNRRGTAPGQQQRSYNSVQRSLALSAIGSLGSGFVFKTRPPWVWGEAEPSAQGGAVGTAGFPLDWEPAVTGGVRCKDTRIFGMILFCGSSSVFAALEEDDVGTGAGTISGMHCDTSAV